MTDERIAGLRARILEQDRAIITALNARLELVADLKRHKDAEGITFLDPERERALLEELQAANAGPLSQAGLSELVGELLALTKRELERRTG